MNFIQKKWFFIILSVGLFASFYVYMFHTFNNEPIKVGILHSRTGSLAITEEAIIKSTLLAIRQINRSGGILGRLISPILADGKSDPDTFVERAKFLIEHEKVEVIFGCWSSASKKAITPIVEENNKILFYPSQYEGVEQSPNIVYTGAVPNQQIIPAIEWSLKNLGKKIFLVGTDYIYVHIANEIIKQTATIEGGEIVGESYIKLGEKSIQSTIEQIKKTKPNIIVNNLNGSSNIALFQQVKPILEKNSAILSFSISEVEIPSIGINNVVDSYACWTYFESHKSPENDQFLKAITEEYGHDQLVNGPMEAGYISVNLWAKAVENSQSLDTKTVLDALKKIVFKAPEGLVKVDSQTQHTWKTSRLGKVLPNGQFNIVWSSDQPIKPAPYPNDILKNEFDWEKFSQKLYKMWGNKWSA